MAGKLLFSVLAVVIAVGMIIPSVSAEPFANQHFERNWARTDQPVDAGMVSRTWMWGPGANTPGMFEEYLESPNGERIVQYFDKSRKEITHPDGDQSSIWYVTNGLLATELITGEMQLGDDKFRQYAPAELPVAGDLHPNSPTYATWVEVVDIELSPQTVPPGSPITQTLGPNGEIGDNPDLSQHGVYAAEFVPDTNHVVASVFWEFMNSTGLIYEANEYRQDLLFENPYFAVGFPLAEAFWVYVPVGGTFQWVLVQCFQRRCLTYTPGNDEGWKVEAGNIGQHYYIWRYGNGQPGNGDDADDTDPGEPTEIVVPGGNWEFEFESNREYYDENGWLVSEEIYFYLISCDGLGGPWFGSLFYNYDSESPMHQGAVGGTAIGFIDDAFANVVSSPQLSLLAEGTFPVIGGRDGTDAAGDPWGPETFDDENVAYQFRLIPAAGHWSANVTLEVVHDGAAPFPLYERTYPGQLTQMAVCE